MLISRREFIAYLIMLRGVEVTMMLDTWHVVALCVVIGAISASTAGVLAFSAAKRLVDGTRSANAESVRLLHHLIGVQNDHMNTLRAGYERVSKREVSAALYAVSIIVREVQQSLNDAIAVTESNERLTQPLFSERLVEKVERAYPDQRFLEPSIQSTFQMIDSLVHGAGMETIEKMLAYSDELEQAHRQLLILMSGYPAKA